MCMHTTNRTHFVHVLRFWSRSVFKECSAQQEDLVPLRDETDMRRESEYTGYREGEEKGRKVWVGDCFGDRKDGGERGTRWKWSSVNMCYSNTACSNVKHKRQSCQTFSTSLVLLVWASARCLLLWADERETFWWFWFFCPFLSTFLNFRV